MPESSKPFEKLSDEAKARVLKSVKRSQDKGTLTPLPAQDREPEEKPHDESGEGYEWAGAE